LYIIIFGGPWNKKKKHETPDQTSKVKLQHWLMR